MSLKKNLDADIIFTNAKIVTADDNFSIASSISIKSGKILSVGSEEEVKNDAGPKTKIYDVRNKMILPGLIDGHAHLLDFGLGLNTVDLHGCKSAEEVCQKVKDAYLLNPKKQEWLRGRGWNPTLFPHQAYPSKKQLDHLPKEIPVFLMRFDGHGAIANQKALELAGITQNTPNPEGGEILKDKEGNPTGVLIETAVDLVEKIIPALTPDQRQDYMIQAAQYCNQIGLTCLHDGIAKPEYIKDYEDLYKKKKLPIRISGMLRDQQNISPSDLMLKFKRNNDDEGFFNVLCYRLIADGGLGASGAALREAYSDQKSHYGYLLYDDDFLSVVCEAAIKQNFQVCTHAIGDKAVGQVLTAYEKALKSSTQDSRFKLEHASVMTNADIEKAAKNGIILSVQPSHIAADMNWIGDRLGKRENLAYRFRDALDAGLSLSFGSDFPVEDPNPFLGIYCAITRKKTDGAPKDGWYNDQTVTRKEAIWAYSLWAARAGRQEKFIGSLEPGKQADLIILDQNILECTADNVLNTKVITTILNGHIVYGKIPQ